MPDRTATNGLEVDSRLFETINNRFLPDTGVEVESYWRSFSTIVERFTPRNQRLLENRNLMQQQIDKWHVDNASKFDVSTYKAFLREIGYLADEKADFHITTENVDQEIASIAGPQLVAPLNNARYALNAANARWGSLYDALYGTDVLKIETEVRNDSKRAEIRRASVIKYAATFLDKSVPLVSGSHIQVRAYQIIDGKLSATLMKGGVSTFVDPDCLIGYKGTPTEPSLILLKHNGLHIEIHIDKEHPVGQENEAGVCDIVLESAITTIQDLEDSVATVDAEEKLDIYEHWFGLVKGTLTANFSKNGVNICRTLNPDRCYSALDGRELILPGRAIMLIRHVGHLMQNPAVLDHQGEEVFEGIMDAMIASLISLHDIKGNVKHSNSKTGSIYVVKPKLHGPDETTFAVELFAEVEKSLGMPKNTIKLGIMDEERRTTVNLKECIRAASDRVIFINTGFLDRTGDEIHTSMEAGPMVRKADMKNQRWIKAYERWNVDIGIKCGLPGRAQIGKGMWAMPDEMATMMETKIEHPASGANTAWVPSPTAATLHAMHYHEINVAEHQLKLRNRKMASLDDILTIPIERQPNWSIDEINTELDNNCQGLLGYVVRWIDQGVGCSKVPDINNIGLMEDRATLRISSQHIANWLHHNVISKEQVMDSLRRMARIVDQQNTGDPNYINMSPNYDGLAFKAAQDLIFLGRKVENGYTEPVLHSARLKLKSD
ncbi:MAG: malate synthase G [Acidiferrobacteraceae bacterium]|nr:malate synthase G [Acidiferrobacteraceae bacterium]